MPSSSVAFAKMLKTDNQLERLIEVLRDEKKSDRARRNAAVELGNLGDKRAVPILMKTAKKDKSDRVRRSAIRALGKFDEKRVVDYLIEVFKVYYRKGVHFDRSYFLLAAVSALGETKNSRAIEPLIEILGQRWELLRSVAIRALRQMGKPAVEPILNVLGNPKVTVRAGAADALGSLGDDRAIVPLAIWR